MGLTSFSAGAHVRVGARVFTVIHHTGHTVHMRSRVTGGQYAFFDRDVSLACERCSTRNDRDLRVASRCKQCAFIWENTEEERRKLA